ncbi:MAG: hypothetical protein WB630_20490 [Candidatus Acidiferrales bacterium]
MFRFQHDLFGLTLGGGQINNLGRYLVLIAPINGETAVTAATSSPYFTGNPGDPFKACPSDTSRSAGSTTIATQTCRMVGTRRNHAARRKQR